jgi:hypothetical protein
MSTKSISELHAEHTEFLNKLNFYKDEIALMRNRVEEVAGKNSNKEVLAHIEHFQNQLIIQRNNIDELSHAVKDHDSYLENRVKENPVSSDVRQVNDHPLMRDNVLQFEKVFNELRHELNSFLSKTM